MTDTSSVQRCAMHWFAYYGWVGSSSPVCVRCGAPNPHYRPDDDPKATHATRRTTRET